MVLVYREPCPFWHFCADVRERILFLKIDGMGNFFPVMKNISPICHLQFFLWYWHTRQCLFVSEICVRVLSKPSGQTCHSASQEGKDGALNTSIQLQECSGWMEFANTIMMMKSPPLWACNSTDPICFFPLISPHKPCSSNTDRAPLLKDLTIQAWGKQCRLDGFQAKARSRPQLPSSFQNCAFTPPHPTSASLWPL